MQVTFSGRVDPVTGMVVDLAALDRFAASHLLEIYDHQNLNTFAAFEAVVPSTENLCLEIFRMFKLFPQARLEQVRIEETGNNSFVYAGPAESAE